MSEELADQITREIRKRDGNHTLDAWQIGEIAAEVAEEFYRRKQTTRKTINASAYQQFQRAYELGRSPKEIAEVTGFGRSTVFMLIRDYKLQYEYYQRFAASHSTDEKWQSETPCPNHPPKDEGITTVFEPAFDIDTNRVRCMNCDWCQDFSRYPAIKKEEK